MQRTGTPNAPQQGRLARHLFLATLILVVPGTHGCGKNLGSPLDSDPGRIGLLVCDVNDARQEPKNLSRHFTSEAPPDRQLLSKLRKYSVAEVGSATVTGDQATIKVIVRDEAAGKEVGTVEWTFVKKGEMWKVKSAPMP